MSSDALQNVPADHDAAGGTTRRALVLGGGGVAGIAWHLGVLAELLERGVDVDAADLVVGTSAGSVAGSILRFGQVGAVYDQQLGGEADVFGDGDGAPVFDMAAFGAQLQTILAGARSAQDARARLGRAALQFSQGAESPLLAQLGAQFPSEHGWPEGPLGVCVVEAETGEFRVLEKASGVELFRAVAASCSVPLVFPPVEIDGSPFVDGGVRSATNADVAAGYDRVLVLSCGPEDPGSPMGPQLDAAVASLRAGSEGAPPAEVMVIGADEASILAFGANSLADAARVPSARAGRAQAAAAVDAIRAFWA